MEVAIPPQPMALKEGQREAVSSQDTVVVHKQEAKIRLVAVRYVIGAPESAISNNL